METDAFNQEADFVLDLRGPRKFAALLLVVFFVLLLLKLTSVVSWSWWVITLPLWLVPAVSCFVFAVVLFNPILNLLRESNANNNPQEDEH